MVHNSEKKAVIHENVILIIIIIVSSRGSFAQPSYGIQAQHWSNLLIGQELVFEHEYAVRMRHMR